MDAYSISVMLVTVELTTAEVAAGLAVAVTERAENHYGEQIEFDPHRPGWLRFYFCDDEDARMFSRWIANVMSGVK